MKKNKKQGIIFIRLQELISKHYFETLNYVHMNLEKNLFYLFTVFALYFNELRWTTKKLMSTPLITVWFWRQLRAVVELNFHLSIF